MLFHINFFARTEWHTQKRFPGDDGVAGDLSFRLQCLVAFEVAVQLIVGETGAGNIQPQRFALGNFEVMRSQSEVDDSFAVLFEFRIGAADGIDFVAQAEGFIFFDDTQTDIETTVRRCG